MRVNESWQTHPPKSFKICEVSQMTNTIIPYNEEEIKQLSAIELLEVVKSLNID